jgi:hypothetical protein
MIVFQRWHLDEVVGGAIFDRLGSFARSTR